MLFVHGFPSGKHGTTFTFNVLSFIIVDTKWGWRLTIQEISETSKFSKKNFITLHYTMFVPPNWAVSTRTRTFQTKSSWWFGTFSIFPHIENNHPIWLIFFRGVETTNQKFYGAHAEHWCGEPTQIADGLERVTNHGFAIHIFCRLPYRDS